MDRYRQPKAPARLSDQMYHVMWLASEQGRDISHVPLVDGKGSQSRTVGRSLTIEALQRHGWLTRGRPIALTPEGRAKFHEERDRRSK